MTPPLFSPTNPKMGAFGPPTTNTTIVAEEEVDFEEFEQSAPKNGSGSRDNGNSGRNRNRNRNRKGGIHIILLGYGL